MLLDAPYEPGGMSLTEEAGEVVRLVGEGFLNHM
jgi:hypothetical protein